MENILFIPSGEVTEISTMGVNYVLTQDDLIFTKDSLYLDNKGFIGIYFDQDYSMWCVENSKKELFFKKASSY